MCTLYRPSIPGFLDPWIPGFLKPWIHEFLALRARPAARLGCPRESFKIEKYWKLKKNGPGLQPQAFYFPFQILHGFKALPGARPSGSQGFRYSTNIQQNK